MGKAIKNVVIILGFATLAWGGYYLYTIQSESALQVSSDEELQSMLSKTSVFIERRQALDQMSLTFELFEDQGFRSLRSHSKTLESAPTGRENPFAPVGVGGE